MTRTATTPADAPPPPPASVSPLEALEPLVARLLQYHSRTSDADALAGLRLAAAALRNLRRPAETPPQVVVVGPTQTGKSTVVNLLLGQAVAEASPLAGFTVHPQGFAVGATGDDAWAAHVLPGYEHVRSDALLRERLDQFSLAPVDPPPIASLLDATLPRCALWDTPDFDSLAAATYSAGQLATTALADVLVLVLTKEKYADLAVWRWLALCAPLGRPLVICLNKSTPDSEPAVLASLRERLAERGRAWGDVPIVALPYDADLPAHLAGLPTQPVSDLRSVVCNRIDDAAAELRASGAARLIREHWETWTAPVQVERTAREAWTRMVAHAAGEFVDAYRRDYLDHAERYDSFRRASLAVLDLIELPGVGPMISQARQLVTWPARQLFAAAGRFFRPQPRGPTPHSLGVEAGVLIEAWRSQLAGLLRDVTRSALGGRPDARFWSALAAALDARSAELERGFETAITTHHQRVSADVEAATRELYDAIRKDPARLAILRAMRAGMDASSILLAIKTGGLTLLDAVWAPAAFGAASLLLEGAANLDTQRVNANLKRRQLEAVQQALVPDALAAPLNAVADGLGDAALLNLSDADLAAAAAALDRLEAGHG